jgi:RimJ/RimL family protein N-acetyltransferase
MAPEADAAFLVRLLNQESFLRFIGDRGVRSLEDAVRYARRGPLESYARHGFGLLVVERRPGGDPIGICGLLQRESLDAPDLGFAFMPEAWGQGLAHEAAAAVLADARVHRGLRRTLAVTQRDNRPSIRLLARLGFRREGGVRLAPGGPELELYAGEGEWALGAAGSGSR